MKKSPWYVDFGLSKMLLQKLHWNSELFWYLKDKISLIVIKIDIIICQKQTSDINVKVVF